MEEAYKQKEAKLDLMQEMERLKEMKRIEDKENELKKMRQQGNKVILEQIAQNKLERIKQKEIEEKERIELLKKIERENELEKQKNILKARENEKKLKESLEANRLAILEKQRKLKEEKEALQKRYNELNENQNKGNLEDNPKYTKMKDCLKDIMKYYNKYKLGLAFGYAIRLDYDTIDERNKAFDRFDELKELMKNE